MPAECTHILPDRRKCAQFALRGKPYCRPHMDPERRRRSDDLRNLDIRHIGIAGAVGEIALDIKP